MTEADDSRTLLIETITDAFGDVEYPGDGDLTSSFYGEETAAVIIDFKGKTDWRVLDSGFLNQAPDGWGTALSFLSDNALRFYLPAYMIADVRGELDTANDPAVRLCSSVTVLGEQQKISQQWGGGTMGDRARACFARFSAAQVSAIVAYLRWRLENTEGGDIVIEQALEHYWNERNANPKN